MFLLCFEVGLLFRSGYDKSLEMRVPGRGISLALLCVFIARWLVFLPVGGMTTVWRGEHNIGGLAHPRYVLLLCFVVGFLCLSG